MKFFAHIETGVTVDVSPAVDLADYQHIMGVHNGWQIVEVPANTLNGATSDGHGGWTNPVAQVPAKKSMQLSGVEFHNYCAATLGVVNSTSALVGMARLGDILGAMQAVPGGLVKIAANRYQAAGGVGGRFVLNDIKTLMGALVSANIVLQAEADALIAGWPQE